MQTPTTSAGILQQQPQDLSNMAGSTLLSDGSKKNSPPVNHPHLSLQSPGTADSTNRYQKITIKCQTEEKNLYMQIHMVRLSERPHSGTNLVRLRPRNFHPCFGLKEILHQPQRPVTFLTSQEVPASVYPLSLSI